MEEKVRFPLSIVVASVLATRAHAAESRSFQWLPGWSSSPSLTGARIDSDDEALRLFHTLFPDLASCALTQPRIVNDHGITHALYALTVDGVEIAKTAFVVHADANSLVLLNGALPQRLPTTFPDFPDLPAPHDLRDAERVWFLGEDEAIAAWRGWRLDSGAPARVIAAAGSGAVLDVDTAAFDAYAPVFEKSPLDAETTIQSLEELNIGETLDGTYFRIFGPTNDSERARLNESVFTYDPDDDPALFDQVQTYFNLTRALNWFVTELGWDPESTTLDVFTHATPTNNARYVPAVANHPGWLGFGDGDGKSFRFFSRDSDVATHEFAHHIIYRTLKSARDESGVLHEGTADYFAYAMNEDPNLGEAVMIPSAPLRTALIAETRRYDDLDQPLTTHHRGQYWSALLWDIRTEIGANADRLVLRALSYLHAESGIADMLAALLAADRELFADDTHACLIYRRALVRGFSRQMAAFDGSPCGLDLARLAADRQTELAREMPHKARWCGVVAGGGGDAAGWLLLPCLIVLIVRRRRHEL